MSYSVQQAARCCCGDEVEKLVWNLGQPTAEVGARERAELPRDERRKCNVFAFLVMLVKLDVPI